MRVVARRRGGYAHDVEIEGGHSIIAGEPPDAGGNDEGPSPTRLLAASLAACTAITMEMYADRKEWDLDDLEVAIDTTYDGYVPVRFDVTIDFPQNLGADQVRKLLVIAEKCPVHKAITGDTTITVTSASPGG